jgi:intron-binding protein aquarius
MVGDNNQLPPIVKNKIFERYSNFSQSLFSRLIKLKVPFIELDYQYRMRNEISNLFLWKYKNLKNNEISNEGNLFNDLKKEFKNKYNPGFSNNFQFINVDDYFNVGESTPKNNPFFYQNLGEAEFIVHIFMYMRIIGYPNDKISILTTYNGQKNLINDILKKRCKNLSFFGLPKSVSTVDDFQGNF